MHLVERKIRWKIVLIFAFLFFATSPFFYLGVNFALGIWGLKETEIALKTKDLSKAEKNIFLVRNSFARSGNFVELLKPFFQFFGLSSQIERIEKATSLMFVSSDSVGQTLLAAKESGSVFRKLLAGEDAEIKESFQKINSQLNIALEGTSVLQLLLKNFSGNEFLVGQYVLKAKENLPKIRSTLSQTQQIAKLAPAILGAQERKTYLFLFQNNMELRPTGGFIGSYGILTLEKGRLIDWEIQDVYFADGQLKGHVEPPSKIKEFLGWSGGWYLRDSNWDPDFPTSARRAEWFLEKEVGRKVDGVIAVDFFVIQRFLEIFQPIDLVDYGEKVTAANFFERAQFHNEVGFFPGSREKRNFLQAVNSALQERVRTASQQELLLMAMSLIKSLEEKDILLTFHDEKAMDLATKFNWEGGVKSAGCPVSDTKCLEDSLLVVEANVGVNKANYFLERSLSLETSLVFDGDVEKKLTIFYENKSPSTVFPAGLYKSYLRVYTPEGSSLENCSIENPSGLLALTGRKEGCRVEETEEHKKRVFGFLVEVPVGEKRKIEIQWRISERFSGGRYLFLLQKQSGTKNDKFLLFFDYPSDFQVLPRVPGGLTGEGKLVYNMQLVSDRVIELNFRKAP